MNILVVIILAGICHVVLPLMVSQEHISVTLGESFNFSCGPSTDSLEGITVTLNNNELPEERVTPIGTQDNVSFYMYRNTTREDNGTKIVCASGKDVGNIYLIVFYAPSISLNKNSFIIEEGKSFSIPFTVEANPKPDGYALLFKNVIISNVFINSTIEFSNISRSQAGEYTIRISNNISEAFFNFNVDVRYPPAFNDPILPSGCHPAGTNITYNCSTMSVVRGNPQPNVTANITQSGVDALEGSGDTVKIIGGTVGSSVNVTCTADNGVGPSATASGFLRFGRVPGPVENIQIMPDFKSLKITWNAQTDTGCPELVVYQGEVKRWDTNDSIESFNTIGSTYTVPNLYHNTEYVVLLRATNELGTSSYVSDTTRTKAINITITAMDVRIVGSILVISWEYIKAGLEDTDVNITVVYERIIDGTPQPTGSYTAHARDTIIKLKIEDAGMYRVTIYIVATNEESVSDTKTMVATNEENISDTNTMEVNNTETSPPGSGAVCTTKVLNLMITMIILVLACILL